MAQKKRLITVRTVKTMVVSVKEQTIWGVEAEISYAADGQPNSKVVMALWKRFYATLSERLKGVSPVFGVYSRYAAKSRDASVLLVGSADDRKGDASMPLSHVTIPSGTYMVFKAKGDMPHTTFTTWAKIHDYFLLGGLPYRRTYTTDFERYPNKGEVHIHVAVSATY